VDQVHARIVRREYLNVVEEAVTRNSEVNIQVGSGTRSVRGTGHGELLPAGSEIRGYGLEGEWVADQLRFHLLVNIGLRTHRRDSLVEETSVQELLRLWPSASPWPSPFDLAAAGELERRVERALSTLSPQYREVLLLVGHEGLTPTDAALVCGISPEALRQRLSRARAALAEKLRETPAVAALRKGYVT
jgi:RNA polymerase sigma factor (sigma-70 family)